MAYTKNPSISTYDTQRLNLVINPLHRSGSLLNKDARLVNMMVEVLETPDKQNTKVFVKTRPGLASAYTTAAGTARGLYYWTVSGVGYIISCSGNKVYSNGTLIITIGTSTGEVGFTEHVDSTGTVTLFMCDGTNAWVWTSPTVAPVAVVPNNWTATTTFAVNAKVKPTVSNTFFYKATAITTGITGGTQPTWPTTIGATVVDGGVTWTCIAGSFPTPHIPMPVFLDGYILLAKAGSQDVYNSNLDGPDLWTAGDFISAEMYPDKIVALSKNNNYVYAVGGQSVEYLYDIAAASGSPLGRHESAVQQFGTVAPASVVQTEEEVILIGETGNGGHTVWTINGFKASEIGTPPIRSIFRAEAANLSGARCHCIRVSGQKLYIITLNAMTLVYSFDTKMWSEWYSGATNNTNFVGSHSADGPNGQAYILDYLNGTVYTISEDNHTDNGAVILAQAITPKYDFDSFNRKFMHRLALIGDIPDGSGAGNVLQVYWTDDDYQTWVGPRDLSFDNDFPCIAQLGVFRRRAFKFEYSQPYLLRLEAFEVDINKGSQ